MGVAGEGSTSAGQALRGARQRRLPALCCWFGEWRQRRPRAPRACRMYSKYMPERGSSLAFFFTSILSHVASKKSTNGLATRTGSSRERNSTVPTAVLQAGGCKALV